MLFLFLWACHVDTVCVQEEIEVADDDALGDLDVTVGDLVADLSGVRTFPAVDAVGAAITAELGLARADAPAIFTDASWEDGPVRPGLGLSQNMMLVICDDALSVPFEVDLASSDGAVALAGEVAALSELRSDTSIDARLVSNFDADGNLDRDGAAGLLEVSFVGPELTRVRVTGEERLLEFPAPAAE